MESMKPQRKRINRVFKSLHKPLTYAGYKGKAQWVAPKPFKWNYASFGQAQPPAQAPDEVFDMMCQRQCGC